MVLHKIFQRFYFAGEIYDSRTRDLILNIHFKNSVQNTQQKTLIGWNL